MKILNRSMHLDMAECTVGTDVRDINDARLQIDLVLEAESMEVGIVVKWT
jgi:hypothetical protein